MPTRTTNCLCGSTIKLTTPSQRAMNGVMAIWWRDHQGDGHGPATAEQARRARDRGTVRDRPEQGQSGMDDHEEVMDGR